MPERKTLTHYTIEAELRHPGSTGDFSGLLNAVATAMKVISNKVSRGALAGVLGSAEVQNVQGEVQKRLDVISNEVMIGETEWTGHLAAMVSEEMEDVYPIPATARRGKYLLVFDPLDGSSNIDVNTSVGTIFSILRSPDPVAEPRAGHFLQPGTAQDCAGFALYGPSTMLILTTGEGVDGFTSGSRRCAATSGSAKPLARRARACLPSDRDKRSGRMRPAAGFPRRTPFGGIWSISTST